MGSTADYGYSWNEIEAIRSIVFGGGKAVPTTIVPHDLWNSEKLNNSLRDIDHAIDAHQFNRATTLAYTCLEGLYKAYVRRHVPDKADLTDFIQLCKAVKDDITKKLKAEGPFPEQIINAIPTLTNAVANSRNGFSESHFAEDSHKCHFCPRYDQFNRQATTALHLKSSTSDYLDGVFIHPLAPLGDRKKDA